METTIRLGDKVTPKTDTNLIAHDSECQPMSVPNGSVGEVLELIQAGTYGVFVRVDWTDTFKKEATGLHSDANILLCDNSKNYCNKCGSKLKEMQMFTSIIRVCPKCG